MRVETHANFCASTWDNARANLKSICYAITEPTKQPVVLVNCDQSSCTDLKALDMASVIPKEGTQFAEGIFVAGKRLQRHLLHASVSQKTRTASR